MKKQLKQASHFFKKTARRAGLGFDSKSLKTDRTETIWPPGTWTLAYRNLSNAECDFLAQTTLLDSYTLQISLEYEKTWGMKAGGMAGTNALSELPMDWLPSRAHLQELFKINNWDFKFLHYMIARLESLGHLLP